MQRKTFKNNSEVYSTRNIREMPQKSKQSIKEENLKKCFPILQYKNINLPKTRKNVESTIKGRNFKKKAYKSAGI